MVNNDLTKYLIHNFQKKNVHIFNKFELNPILSKDQKPCNDLIFTVPTLCTHPVVDEKVWNRKSNSSIIVYKGRSPLHVSAWFGQDDVVTFLLDHVTEKMPQTAIGWNPLHYSSIRGHLNATKILLDAIGNNSSYITQHANEVANYYTPLHFAAQEGKTAIVKLFLDRIVGNKNPKNKPGFKVIIHKSCGEQVLLDRNWQY